MSAEDALHEAATRIRKDQSIELDLGHIYESEFQAWVAVADWLDGPCPNDETPALAVARAYLGESA